MCCNYNKKLSIEINISTHNKKYVAAVWANVWANNYSPIQMFTFPNGFFRPRFVPIPEASGPDKPFSIINFLKPPVFPFSRSLNLLVRRNADVYRDIDGSTTQFPLKIIFGNDKIIHNLVLHVIILT